MANKLVPSEIQLHHKRDLSTVVNQHKKNHISVTNQEFINYKELNQQTTYSNLDNFPFYNNTETENLSFSLMPDYPNLISTDSRNDNDIIPGYIDINSLVLPNCFPIDPCDDEDSKVLKEKDTNKVKAKQDTVNTQTTSNNSNDMDVVFIKQYKFEAAAPIPEAKTLTSINKKPVSKRSCEKLPLRRNPKRKVQQQKGSILYDDDIFLQDIAETLPRRSTRFSGFSSNYNCKEWNETVAVDKYEKISVDGDALNVKTKSRNKSNARKKCNYKKNEYKMNREFATQMHHKLHYVLSYITSLKEYHSILKKANIEVNIQDKLVQANKMFADTCTLYCIANNISDSTLANYLGTLYNQEDVTGFLDTVILECDRQEELAG